MEAFAHTLMDIGKGLGWAAVAVYALYGVSFGIAAVFARPGGEH
jgi:hypothetical protein